jgi:arylformamidase
MRIIDLTMPIITDHVRWASERSVRGDLDAGDIAQVTTVKVSCHSFTHVDARRHYFKDGDTIENTPLDALVGDAVVVDLMDVGPNEAIGPEKLAERGALVAAGSRVVLKSGWHRHRDFNTREFWTEAPYLTQASAQWLLDKGIMTICYDFPQDYVIRLLLDGIQRPVPEHVTHDILLRNGVHMVEYLTNTAAISAARVFLSAAPLKIPEADGAPARVYVVEGM